MNRQRTYVRTRLCIIQTVVAKMKARILCALKNQGTMVGTEGAMHNEFTAIFDRDEDWVIAYCQEIPGANGQGRTREKARQNLAEAISLILEDCREDALRGLPADIKKETVVVAA